MQKRVTKFKKVMLVMLACSFTGTNFPMFSWGKKNEDKVVVNKGATLVLPGVSTAQSQPVTRSLSESDLGKQKSKTEAQVSEQTQNVGNVSAPAKGSDSEFEPMNGSNLSSSRGFQEVEFNPTLGAAAEQASKANRKTPPSLNPVSEKLVKSIVENKPIEHTFTDEQKAALKREVESSKSASRTTISPVAGEKIGQLVNHPSFEEASSLFPQDKNPIKAPPLPPKPAHLRRQKTKGPRWELIAVAVLALVGTVGGISYALSRNKDTETEVTEN